MFKKYFKAFTVIELILSIVILSLTTMFAINITLKKTKTIKKAVTEKVTQYVCFMGSQHSDEHPEQLTYNNGYCEIQGEQLRYLLTKEFIEIRLIGAGAATGYKSSAGEDRAVFYPSLAMPYRRKADAAVCSSRTCERCNGNTCTRCVKGYRLDGNGTCNVNFRYRAVLGKPIANQNGGETYFAVIESGNMTILETAAGGTISNDRCPENADCTPITKCPSSTNEHGCTGAGSNAKRYGEVVLSW